MISKYIKSERSVILCVMPAGEDLEADIALDLIKDIDTLKWQEQLVLTN